MKTKIVLLTLTVFVLTQLNARAQKINYGIVAGVDMANLNITGIETKNPIKWTPTFNVNAHVGYRSNTFWGLSVEPGFIVKGGATEDPEIKMKLNYLQMPLLVDFYLNERVSVSCGPELAYLLSATQELNGKSYDFEDWYNKKFEFSGVVGLNYKITRNFDLGLRFNLGLTQISEAKYFDENGIRFSNAKEYNQYLQCFVRFKI